MKQTKRLTSIFYSILILGMIFLFAGCGSNSKIVDAINENSSNSESNNNSGYPNVAGKYSLTTKEISYTCTDGDKGTSPAFSQNVVLSQTENSIVVSNADGDSAIPGITIIEKNELKGNVEKNNSFILNSTMLAYIDGIPGELTVTYNFIGSFNNSGWSGNYTFSVFSQDYLITCNYSTTFSGSKISSSKQNTFYGSLTNIDSEENGQMFTLLGILY